MKLKNKRNYVLIGLVLFTFVFGLATVSAMTNDINKDYYYKQAHYSETNCNVESHYVNGTHYHDTENCTNSNHNHNTNNHHQKNCNNRHY